jgi:hypothetical protein
MDRYKKNLLHSGISVPAVFLRPIAVEKRLKNVESKTLKVADNHATLSEKNLAF